MMYRRACFDDADDGEDDDDETQGEDGGERRLLLAVNLEIPKKSKRQSHDKQVTHYVYSRGVV